jgi:sulfur relay (sulfurtransferase) complex TusBCD TusD component (DsrE family)
MSWQDQLQEGDEVSERSGTLADDPSTLDELTDWTVEADRVLTF